jgi:hypothetical protein
MLNSRFLVKFQQFLFFSLFFVLTFSASAQNFLINPATDGGFEGAHGWTIVNHPTGENKWFIGGAVKTAILAAVPAAASLFAGPALVGAAIGLGLFLLARKVYLLNNPDK